MHLKLTLLAALTAAATLVGTQAATITLPGDSILGGKLNAGVFTVATPGGVSGENAYPSPNEVPAFAIDGLSGAAPNNGANLSKYLNFGITNTGYLVTPAGGVSNITGIFFATANDADERDPTSYQLFGSNTVTAVGSAGTTFNLSDFTPISSGALTLPTARSTLATPVTDSISFANPANYTSYLLIFPTVRNTRNGTPMAANSMSVGEAELTGTFVPEPSSMAIAAIGAIGMLGLRRRRS